MSPADPSSFAAWEWLDTGKTLMTFVLLAINVYVGLLARSTARRLASDGEAAASEEEGRSTVLLVIGMYLRVQDPTRACCSERVLM